MATGKTFVALLLGFMLLSHGGTITNMDPQDPTRGSAFSSPQEQIAPNGDIVSPYPPYFRPQPSR